MSPDAREIGLTGGFVALVDAEDFAWLSEHRWVATGLDGNTRYVVTKAVIAGTKKFVKMHRLIAGAKLGEIVDRVNGDGLDNRRANLRICTHADNMRNRRKHKNNASGSKGAYYDRERNRWRAILLVDGKQKQVGTFDNQIQAARAYDIAALQYFGEFARLNFSPHRDWLFAHEHSGLWPSNAPAAADLRPRSSAGEVGDGPARRVAGDDR